MAVLLNGNEIAARVRARVGEQVEALKTRGVTPGLAVILAGDDPASAIYVRRKEKACGELGIYSEKHTLPANVSQGELLGLIATLNKRAEIHGILCQLPLPPQLEETAVLEAIPPEKDVDAFHPVNVGRLHIGSARLLPCTPAGVMEILRAGGVDPAGKQCVVVGRSNIVGKPMAALLLQANGTVTVCHSKTRDLAAVTRRADILVAAVGRANFIGAEMVKPGAVVIDVGMNRLEDGHLCGDVNFAEVEPLASAITPVPGGVGPMTIAMLMQNTVTAARMAAGL